MKTINKTISEKYFDPEDTKKFNLWLVYSDLTYGEVAYKLGYSYVYIYLIINGKRPVNDKFLKKLKEIGYEM